MQPPRHGHFQLCGDDIAAAAFSRRAATTDCLPCLHYCIEDAAHWGVAPSKSHVSQFRRRAPSGIGERCRQAVPLQAAALHISTERRREHDAFDASFRRAEPLLLKRLYLFSKMAIYRASLSYQAFSAIASSAALSIP